MLYLKSKTFAVLSLLVSGVLLFSALRSFSIAPSAATQPFSATASDSFASSATALHASATAGGSSTSSTAPHPVAVKGRPVTCLLHIDTRPLPNDETPQHSFETAPYYALVAANTQLYARRHGYEFLYYQVVLDGQGPLRKEQGACHLDAPNSPTQHAVWRGGSWCKLLGAADLLYRLNTGGFPSTADCGSVVVLDTDILLLDYNRTVEDFLAKTPTASTEAGLARSGASASLAVPWNAPWTMWESCAGAQFWRAGPAARRIVARWWRAFGGRYALSHEFEQAALNQIVLRSRGGELRPDIAILETQAFFSLGPKSASPQFMLHWGMLQNDRAEMFRRHWPSNSSEFEDALRSVRVVKVDGSSWSARIPWESSASMRRPHRNASELPPLPNLDVISPPRLSDEKRRAYLLDPDFFFE